MNCNQVLENLSAYLDKAVSADDILRIQNHLENCPACREEYHALERTVAMLAELDEIVPPASFRRELRHKLEEKTRKRFSLHKFIPGWLKNVRRYHLMPVAAALVIMLVILPFIGDNNKLSMRQKAAAPEMAMDSAGGGNYSLATKGLDENLSAQNRMRGSADADGSVPFMAQAPAAAPELTAKTEEAGAGANPDKLAAPDQGEIERKIIKNADISIQVDDYQTTVEAIKNKVSAINGYVANEGVSRRGQEGIIIGHVQVRIPAVHFDEFLTGMDVLGSVNGRNIYTQDVTEEYVDVDSRLKVMRTKEERLLAILTKSGNLSDILAVENELANTRAQLESLEGRLRYLNNRTEFSAISINIEQVAASTRQIYTGGLSGVFGKTKEAFIQAVNKILLGCGQLVVFVGSALPYLILAAIGGVVIRWYLLSRKRKDKV